MKTAELDGILLDYWVAKAENKPALIYDGMAQTLQRTLEDGDEIYGEFSPSTDWSIAGPIIERERIGIYEGAQWPAPGQPPEEWLWYACVGGSPNYGTALEAFGQREQRGPTPLIAAMRAFIASRFGDTVPDEPRAG